MIKQKNGRLKFRKFSRLLFMDWNTLKIAPNSAPTKGQKQLKNRVF